MASYGPSVAKQVLSHPLAQMLLKGAIGAAGGGAILKYVGCLAARSESGVSAGHDFNTSLIFS